MIGTSWRRRIALGVLGGALGLPAGIWLGGQAYVWLGLAQPGDLDQLGGFFQGGMIGMLAGISIGAIAVAPRSLPAGVRARASLTCLAAAAAFGCGIWYVGDFTNADGPGGWEPWVGISLVPLSVAVVWIAVRLTRNSDRK